MRFYRRLSGLAQARRPSALIPPWCGYCPTINSAWSASFISEKIFRSCISVAIRRAVYEKNPWIASSLYAAFVEAKLTARARLLSAEALLERHTVTAAGSRSRKSTK